MFCHSVISPGALHANPLRYVTVAPSTRDTAPTKHKRPPSSRLTLRAGVTSHGTTSIGGRSSRRHTARLRERLHSAHAHRRHPQSGWVRRYAASADNGGLPATFLRAARSSGQG